MQATKHRRERLWQRAVGVLACLTIFCTTYALVLPAITMSEEFYCGYEEHPEHTEACYERGLICEKPIHTHTAECLIDRNVDTENEDIWERSVESAVLTGNWNEDVLAVAKTQLGYTESEQNYRLSADGTARYGYSRYAAWYFGEDDPYAEWNAAFAAFCIRYAGLPEEFPINGDVGAWSAAFTQQGLMAQRAEYTPVSGDLAFFDLTGKGTADTIGIVLSADESSVTVILGDYQNAVSEESFSLDEVLGYGSVQNAYRVYTGEDLEDISEIALYSDPAAVAPDYIGSIDTANAWQIVAEEYTGNAKSAKIGDDVDNDGVAEVLVQKNVVPTANENEFLVYLSISKQMSWDTLLAQSTLGLTTQGKCKESDVGTVVNESDIGGNKTNWCSCF